MSWPRDTDELLEVQRELGAAAPPPPPELNCDRAAGCFVCFSRGRSGPGAPGEPAWAAAVLLAGRRTLDTAVNTGMAGASYSPGLLALREGPLLETVVRRLDPAPTVLLVDATGRDHSRRAGLALHLGAVLDLPTVGVTHRPLLAEADEPGPERGDTAPLLLDGESVGYAVRTRPGTRPIYAHAGWRTSAEQARDVVLAACRRHRTPEPLRRARQLARRTRTAADPRRLAPSE